MCGDGPYESRSSMKSLLLSPRSQQPLIQGFQGMIMGTVLHSVTKKLVQEGTGLTADLGDLVTATHSGVWSATGE